MQLAGIVVGEGLVDATAAWKYQWCTLLKALQLQNRLIILSGVYQYKCLRTQAMEYLVAARGEYE
jgi:hypothetical protein